MTETIPSRDAGLALLKTYNSNEALIQHALAVEAAMRYLARQQGQDEALWGLVGLIHDLDYEQFPDQHCHKTAEILRSEGWPELIVRAVLSHGWKLCTDVEPISEMEKTLYAADELTGLVLKCGEVNIKALELLDKANTGTYGHPEPTQVRISPLKGKAILVSGHDLKDLEELLKQTDGKDVNVYTHGEMLPTHAYPELKKYAHLKGNYGGAWQDQRKEFKAFPGSIVMTTNCIQKPADEYKDRIFTCGLVGWPGVKHIEGRDFAPAIDAALAADGFAEDGPDDKITVGFGRNAVLGVADKVIEAVKGGAIKHFFLIGGCDGAKPGRNLASGMPTIEGDGMRS